uniref:Uncharacterized protein n=1 Tax=Clandestinovirus TaxID=2831644 RepID=A0A8F8PQS6_9VIRU|nr:hypothetical protein KOM_12_129 [Clandestinovirus]
MGYQTCFLHRSLLIMNCVFFAVCAGLIVGMVTGLIWPDSILISFQDETQCTIVHSVTTNSTCCETKSTDCHDQCTTTMPTCFTAYRKNIEGYCCAESRCCLEYDDDNDCEEYGIVVKARICGTCFSTIFNASYSVDDSTYYAEFSQYCERDNFACYEEVQVGKTRQCWFDSRSPEDTAKLDPIEYKWWQFLLTILAGCYSVLFISGGLSVLIPIIIQSAKDLHAKRIAAKKESIAKRLADEQARKQAEVMENEKRAFEMQVDIGNYYT